MDQIDAAPPTSTSRPCCRFADVALAALADAREEIDALNVYPVPDGDTGTNLFLTFEARPRRPGRRRAGRRSPPPASSAYARGPLLGARGNSGVIMSQLVGAHCKRLAAAGPTERAALVVRRGAGRGERGGVRRGRHPGRGHHPLRGPGRRRGRRRRRPPTSGTGSDTWSARRPPRARAALLRTPDQLDVLRDAGVVDAGGRGLCVVLDAAETAVTGKRPVSARWRSVTHAIPVPLPTGDLTEGGPAYEVMYLLDADDDAVPPLRSALGDARRLARRRRRRRAVERPRPRRRRRCRGRGGHRGRPAAPDQGHPLRRAGRRRAPARATAQRRTSGGRRGGRRRAGRRSSRRPGRWSSPGGPGNRPSTGRILEALGGSGGAEIVLLPNDRDGVPAAEAAAQTRA